MKKSFLNVLCIASIVGCTSPDAISMDQSPTVMKAIAAQPSKPSIRVVGNTIYFLTASPDKIKPKDFKDQKAIDVHYSALFAALKKRNPTQNARFAFDHGMRYFFTFNGRSASQRQRGNPLGLGTPELVKRCPASAQLKRLEGLMLWTHPECVDHSVSCRNYVTASGDYMISWNEEMSRLCKGGK